MKRLVFFLEELSARRMLEGVLPRLLPDDVQPLFVVFEGKRDLEFNLPIKLRAWRLPDCRFVVVRDKDAGDCMLIKQQLVKLCTDAGQASVLVRIACHELESFYLGDLRAVEKGLSLNGLSKLQAKRQYRDPDRLTNPSQMLSRLTNGKYQKVSGSTAIGTELCLSSNCSNSFNQLIKGIKTLIQSF